MPPDLLACSKMLQLLANDKLRDKIDALRREKSATLSLQGQLRRDGAKQAGAMAVQSSKVASLIGKLNETTAQVRVAKGLTVCGGPRRHLGLRIPCPSW